MRDAGGDVIGVDWRVPLDGALGAGRRTTARSRATSTPRCCGAPWEAVERETLEVLRSRRRPRRPRVQPRPRRAARTRPSRHLQRLVDLVHERTETGPDVSDAAPIGVLVMAYGTAERPRRHRALLHGHPRRPAADARAPQELRDRYAAIGNRFPLLDITRAQAEGLERAAEPRRRRDAFRAVPRHEALAAVHRRGGRADARGRDRARDRHRDGAALVGDVGRDLRRARPSRRWANGRARVHVRPQRTTTTRRSSRSWPSGCADALAALTAEQRTRRDGDLLARTACPTRTVEDGSLRCLRLRRVRGRLPVPRRPRRRPPTSSRAELGLERHTIAWQSAGRTADPWWGPPIEDVIAELGDGGHPAVVVCSAGFVADHLEILYDLDIEARAIAEAGRHAPRRAPRCRTRIPRSSRCWPSVVRERLAASRCRPWRPDRHARSWSCGGGVAGLTAAHRLLAGRPALDVDRAGGRARRRAAGSGRRRSATSSSRPVPDSFVARKPWAVELCRELGLELEPSPARRGAYIWTERGLVPLPGDARSASPPTSDELVRWPGLSRRGPRTRARRTSCARRARRRRTTSRSARCSDGGWATRRPSCWSAPLLGRAVRRRRRPAERARRRSPSSRAWERAFGSLIRGARAASRAAADAGPMFLRPRGRRRAAPARAGSSASAPRRVRLGTRATRDRAADGETFVVRTDGEALPADGGRARRRPRSLRPSSLAATTRRRPRRPRRRSRTRRPASCCSSTRRARPSALPEATGFVVPRGPGADDRRDVRCPRKWPDGGVRDPRRRPLLRRARWGPRTCWTSPTTTSWRPCAGTSRPSLPLPGRPTASSVVRWPRSMPQYEVGHLERVARDRGLAAGGYLRDRQRVPTGSASPTPSAAPDETAERVRAHLASRGSDR